MIKITKNIMNFLQYADGKNDLKKIAKLINISIREAVKIKKILLKQKLIECEAADELGLSPLGKRLRQRYLSQRSDPLGKFLKSGILPGIVASFCPRLAYAGMASFN